MKKPLQWGAMFLDGSVMHPWNGRTQRQHAEEFVAAHPETLLVCRRLPYGKWMLA